MKRLFDCVFSVVAMALLGPVLLVLGAAVRIRLGRPILFRQERVGRHERPFTLYKLRTMTETPGAGQPDEHRLTAFGRWLRRTSLDEVPELWNVVVGDMSLVGPRPLPVRYLPRYSPEERRRHEVRPGITGWAQIHGRNSLGWDERLALDVWYVDHRSFVLDLRILARTVGVVVRREGISAEGTETMHELRPHLGEPLSE